MQNTIHTQFCTGVKRENLQRVTNTFSVRRGTRTRTKESGKWCLKLNVIPGVIFCRQSAADKMKPPAAAHWQRVELWQWMRAVAGTVFIALTAFSPSLLCIFMLSLPKNFFIITLILRFDRKGKTCCYFYAFFSYQFHNNLGLLHVVQMINFPWIIPAGSKIYIEWWVFR